MRSSCIMLIVLFSALETEAQPFDHSGFDAILNAYVNELGEVDYSGLQANRTELDNYLETIGRISPKSHPERFGKREDRLAYWINAYNALVLRGVIHAYPVKSVKDIKLLSGFFNRTWYTVGGESFTLNSIEHDVLRVEFSEPRIHAAINCASTGCPRLEPSAFFPEGIEEKLENVTRKFLNEERNVTIDVEGKTVTLSKILDWFGDDFTSWYKAKFNVDDASILDYVALYTDGFKNDWNVKYHSYDWSLNDQKK